MQDQTRYTLQQLYAAAMADGVPLESDGLISIYKVDGVNDGEIVAQFEDGLALLGELTLLRTDLATLEGQYQYMAGEYDRILDKLASKQAVDKNVADSIAGLREELDVRIEAIGHEVNAEQQEADRE